MAEQKPVKKGAVITIFVCAAILLVCGIFNFVQGNNLMGFSNVAIAVAFACLGFYYKKKLPNAGNNDNK